MTEIALPVPSRVGQATMIEQSRAVAEVYAAVMIARDNPRNPHAAIRAMEQACSTPELAAKAFYKFPKGGKEVRDASIHLARELARCWGNIQHSVAELRRDDDHGQSEMQAVAWDLESNTRVAAIFIQPHVRDTTDGPKKLVEMRDIYESNANAGARRVRQAIFAVLPRWYVERAKALCTKTLTEGGGKPLDVRIADCLRLFEEYHVTEDDIARKVGRPPARWTPADLAELRITYESLQQGTLSRDEAFPPPLVTPDEVQAAAPSEAPAPDPAPAAPEEPTDEPEVDQAPPELLTKIKNQLIAIGIKEPRDRLWVLQRATGRPLKTPADITTQEGARIADLLVRVKQADDPARALDHVLTEEGGGDG